MRSTTLKELFTKKVKEINRIIRNDGNDYVTVNIAYHLATGHVSEMSHEWLAECITENTDILYSHEEACRLYEVYKSVLDKVKEGM